MLPVYNSKQEILDRLQESRSLVFTAPPGSGKSTLLPQFLLELPALNGEVLVLQPRRLAARMLAMSVAKLSDFTLGKEVGYQVRGDRRLSANTLISYRTEGILLRQLLEDPDLRNVGAVVLDEFHERSWQADVILSFLKALHKRRKDFYLVVMSATLNAAEVCDFLEAPHVNCFVKTFPVEFNYRTFSRNTPLWERALKVIREHVSVTDSGNVLVFMPGAYEIRRTIEACGNIKGIDFLGLHGSMAPEQQDKVLFGGDRRKVIVSTNIAETSLTVEGVDTVVDAGYARMSRFDSSRGLDTLNLETISAFSAEQRGGRAGRLGPGLVYRLWSAEEHERRPEATVPEVSRIDLSEVLLTILSLGKSLESFEWFAKPEDTRIAEALQQLELLGAVEKGQLTAIGIRMSSFPAHPRLARLLIESESRGCTGEASRWAAIVSEKSPLDHKQKLNDDHTPVSDLQAIVHLWKQYEKAADKFSFSRKYNLHGGGLKTLQQVFRQFEKLCRSEVYSEDLALDLARCLLVSFSDRLAVRVDRGTLRYRLVSGQVGELTRTSSARDAQFIIPLTITELNSSGSSRLLLSLASEIPFELIEEFFLDDLLVEKKLVWDPKARRVEQVETISLKGAVLDEKVISGKVNDAATAEILSDKVLSGELKLNSWNAAVDAWMDRVRWVSEVFPEKELIIYEEDDIKLVLMEMFSGCRSFKEIKNIVVIDYFMNLLSWDEQKFVKDMTPERLQLPAGRSIRLSYKPGEVPRGNGFIQDFYGLEETPKVGGGRVKIVLELLAPNRRIIHITNDLEGFWDGVYLDIRSQLAGRYPKHKWI